MEMGEHIKMDQNGLYMDVHLPKSGILPFDGFA
jgi:hypothetical protein